MAQSRGSDADERTDSKTALRQTTTSSQRADLTKRYGDVTVVDGINFDIAKGEIFGLLGPNGAGKTTTILMMLGLTEIIRAARCAYLGTIRRARRCRSSAASATCRTSVGFYDHLTAAENLAYTARLMGFPAAERERRIMAALARVKLRDVANKRVRTFSRGMRQRLGLAEIIIKRAEIAILDEPTSASIRRPRSNSSA